MESAARATIYEEETRGVRVRVRPEYRDDQSSPKDHRYVWSYTVEIINNRKETIRLVERYWRITDVNGHCAEIRGPGVLGETPSVLPGETFRYTSGAPLDAPSGVMEGAYRLQTASGETFEAVVPAFSLDSPHEPARRRPH
ncbi:MAG: Co2+/Mg2+ efflux protein ApaG [Maricaulaceae bacterium]